MHENMPNKQTNTLHLHQKNLFRLVVRNANKFGKTRPRGVALGDASNSAFTRPASPASAIQDPSRQACPAGSRAESMRPS